jgi:hypothetical protein
MAAAGGFDVDAPKYGALPKGSLFSPNLSGSNNQTENTSALSRRSYGQGRPGLTVSGKGTSGKPIEKGKEGGPGGGGGGGKGGVTRGSPGGGGAFDGGVFNVGGQQLEPVPPGPRKIDAGIAPPSGGAGGGSGDGDGNGAGTGDNVGGGGSSYWGGRGGELVMGPRREIREPGEKRTGHGVLDYVGFLDDSCKDKSEKRLQPLCGGKKKPQPLAGPPNRGPTPDPNLVDFNNVVDPVAALTGKRLDGGGTNGDLSSQTVSTQALSKPDQMVTRGTGDISSIKDGLERAFSRSFPENSGSARTGGTATQ